MKGRILAIDPGDKRIGIALSDPSGFLAKPLTILEHVSREKDAAQIVALAEYNEAVCIVIGQALHDNGEMSIQGRKAERLAAAIQTITSIPVVLWDESGTTHAARNIRREMQVSRRKRSGHLDSLAAAILLQDYLDSNSIGQKGHDESN